MKKYTYLTLMAFLAIAAGCAEMEETPEMEAHAEIESCLEDQLAQANMVAYNNEEINCEFFLVLYHYQNKEYYLLGNQCADMITYPTDCEGNQLCVDQNAACSDFYEKAEKIGIVGISE